MAYGYRSSISTRDAYLMPGGTIAGAWGFRMPFAVHRGRRIHYTVEGEGPLVVLQVMDGGSFVDEIGASEEA